MSRKADIILENNDVQEENIVTTDTAAEPEVQAPAVSDAVQDIDLSATKKKKFRIDGDNNKILELNVSDMGIINRLKEAYPKLIDLSNEALALNVPDIEDETTEEAFGDSGSIGKMAAALASIDDKMREYVDYIFGANVSNICAQDGSMFDPFNGKLRFEHIVEVLSALYENNMTDEFSKMRKRVQKHTSKYTKKK